MKTLSKKDNYQIQDLDKSQKPQIFYKGTKVK